MHNLDLLFLFFHSLFLSCCFSLLPFSAATPCAERYLDFPFSCSCLHLCILDSEVSSKSVSFSHCSFRTTTPPSLGISIFKLHSFFLLLFSSVVALFEFSFWRFLNNLLHSFCSYMHHSFLHCPFEWSGVLITVV